jgi:hypothetical protein
MLFIIIFTILTTLVLVLGLISMASGKSFNKKYGTKLMMLRVVLQSLTLVSLAIAYFSW